ncbi:ribonuclease H [Paenibacillus sp. GCM10012307]|uniref:Ribonuclease H n=1 Tax=Paenibacillus roseus TaxID=2798579 RepID=A0A934IX75_9BACL|nr:ribonuclease H family protein [Paenibacillus roseus]MBJ6360946.1 ribonuclease H family protein [Paenibacillus roseus]
MSKSKFYVVWEGKKPGVYTSWPECQKQVAGTKGAKYKSYESKAAADKAFREGWTRHWGQGGQAGVASADTTGKSRTAASKRKSDGITSAQEIDYDSISVDVGTHGNPGPVEYRGVDTRTGQLLFSNENIGKGTNNLGEFLAIVHGLGYLKQQGSSKTVYSDSLNALKWVREKKVSTTLVKDASTRQIWELIERAESWLRNNTYDNKVLKWQTKQWGEIKADYDRK